MQDAIVHSEMNRSLQLFEKNAALRKKKSIYFELQIHCIIRWPSVAPLLIAFLLFQRQFVQSFMHAGIK